eukprot:CAMPEP_0179422784 /NCGR_PEP_ID=MMETSP0799-20121207/10636_1 /TAXON_ID=46947 /ORGANISM="Geminigera cryophila, Strain CCMP2564" /LENGTH=516 /DNA_ID=CAMNT_0021196985 /DNA_START=58 /DNA_END=1608 /DNA_ORIENTATION=-
MTTFKTNAVRVENCGNARRSRVCRSVTAALLGVVCASMCGSTAGELSAGAASHERSQGDKALMEGKLAVALKHFEAAVKMNPADHMNWYKRATAYIIEKKYESALKDLGKVLEIKPDYAQAIDKRAKIYASQGKFGEAREDYQKMQQLKGETESIKNSIQKLNIAEQMRQGGETLMQQGNWGAAKDHLNKAIETATDSVDLLLKRAECHRELGDRENVLADTGKALKVDGKHMGALATRGNAYYDMDEFELAQRHFRQGLKLDPEHKECKASYRKIKQMENVQKAADKEVASGQFNEALESFEKGTKIDPAQQLFAGKMNLGRCKVLLKLKRYAEAVRVCGEVMVIPEERHNKEQRIDTLLSRAEALQGLEEYEEAVRDCERATNLEKENGNTRQKLDHAQRLLKKSRMKDYYKVLEVGKDADDRTIKKAYRKKAAVFHPDKVCSAGACPTKEDQDRAAKKFHEIAEAHEVLTNDEMRAKYDRGEDPLGQEGGGGGGGHPFGGGAGNQHFSFHFGN